MSQIKFTVSVSGLTGTEADELIKKINGKVTSAKLKAKVEDDADEVSDDDEVADDEDYDTGAPAKKKKKAAKKKVADGEDLVDEDDDAEETDDADEESEDDGDGPTLAQMIAEFQKYSKRKGMPAAKKILQLFKAKRVQDLDESVYSKVLAKLKAK